MPVGVNDLGKHTDLFDKDLKKPEARSVQISKKNILFIAFAVIFLQVADTVVLWLMGASKSSTFSGDSLMFSAVTFGILKFIYDKYFLRSCKSRVNEDSNADEVQGETTADHEYQQSATVVVDTMKVKSPPPRNSPKVKSPRPRIRKLSNKTKQAGCEATVWVSSWLRGVALNAKAKKFVPHNTFWMSTLDSAAPAFVPWAQATLNSGAPVFVPQAHAKKEEEMLKSESGGTNAGPVVYRSSHWLNEIGSQEKQKQKMSKPLYAQNKFEYAEPVKLLKAARPMKWQPKVL